MMRVVALITLLLTGCATATRFHTQPEGATLYVDGLLMGETPFVFHNEPGLPRRYHVQIVKSGYEPLDFYLDTRLSWLWGYIGVVTLVPYLWAWSLRGDYVFDMTPVRGEWPDSESESEPELPEAELPEPTPDPEDVRL